MDIVLTGSVAYDYIMKFPGYFKEHILPDRLDSISLSFLVESMVVLRGGVSPNIAYTMALLGSRPRVMATVGEDFETYRAWLEGKGIDTSLIKVIPGVFTASFFANTDRDNAQIASFYPGAMAHAAEISMRDLPSKPDLVVISPNDPEAMNKYAVECGELGISYIYDPSQQIVRMDASHVMNGIRGAKALFVNEYELALIKKITGMSEAEILAPLEFMVITAGKNGAYIYDRGDICHVPAVSPLKIIDPTGIGDAFRGGFLKGYSCGLDLTICGQIGSLAATYCLENDGPQGQEYSPAEFITRFREHFNDGGKLDVILS
jgi:adenosine kinase